MLTMNQHHSMLGFWECRSSHIPLPSGHFLRLYRGRCKNVDALLFPHCKCSLRVIFEVSQRSEDSSWTAGSIKSLGDGRRESMMGIITAVQATGGRDINV